VVAKTEMWSEFDRAVELDALCLDPARGKMAPGDLRVFGGNPNVAGALDILAIRQCPTSRSSGA